MTDSKRLRGEVMENFDPGEWAIALVSHPDAPLIDKPKEFAQIAARFLQQASEAGALAFINHTLLMYESFLKTGHGNEQHAGLLNGLYELLRTHAPERMLEVRKRVLGNYGDKLDGKAPLRSTDE